MSEKFAKRFAVLPNDDGTQFDPVEYIMGYFENIDNPVFPRIHAKFTKNVKMSYLYPVASPVRIHIREEVVKTGSPAKYYLSITNCNECGLVRTGAEFRISEEEYSFLLDTVNKDPISMRCISITAEGAPQLDIVTVDPDTDTSFTFAEVMFKTEEEAEAFTNWPFPNMHVADMTGCESWQLIGKSMPIAEYWMRNRLGIEPHSSENQYK